MWPERKLSRWSESWSLIHATAQSTEGFIHWKMKDSQSPLVYSHRLNVEIEINANQMPEHTEICKHPLVWKWTKQHSFASSLQVYHCGIRFHRNRWPGLTAANGFQCQCKRNWKFANFWTVANNIVVAGAFNFSNFFLSIIFGDFLKFYDRLQCHWKIETCPVFTIQHTWTKICWYFVVR